MSKQATWQRILADSIRDIPSLFEALSLSHDDFTKLNEKPLFPIQVPHTWLQRIQPGDANDPLLLQVIAQRHTRTGFSADPLQEDEFVIHQGVIKKYKNRVLVTLAEACPIHCQYCFRQHFPYQENRLGQKDIKDILTIIENNKDIEEIIFSGGDPLSLPNSVISKWVRAASELKQIKRVRFHTRYPVVIPQRVDDELVGIFERTNKQIIFVIHCNHANEIDHDVRCATEKLNRSGVTVFNQSVLLKNVNDTVSALSHLSKVLFEAKVIPYYIHLLDPVSGTESFYVPDEKAKSLFAELKGELPGYLVPRLVREVAHDVSKRWV